MQKNVTQIAIKNLFIYNTIELQAIIWLSIVPITYYLVGHSKGRLYTMWWCSQDWMGWWRLHSQTACQRNPHQLYLAWMTTSPAPAPHKMTLKQSLLVVIYCTWSALSSDTSALHFYQDTPSHNNQLAYKQIYILETSTNDALLLPGPVCAVKSV